MVGKQFHCSNGKIKEKDLALPINALNSKDIIALELRVRLNVGAWHPQIFTRDRT